MEMKKIRFIGDFYAGYDHGARKDLRLTKKQVITVSADKALELLTDMPEKFKELSWRPKKEKIEEKKVEVEEVKEKKLEPLKDKKLEELKNK